MGGQWKFSFQHAEKDSFDVTKYQQVLKELRAKYEPQFSVMDAVEGRVQWANVTDNVPVDNIFATFSYHCTKNHIYKGPKHGVWTLFWNPTTAHMSDHNDIHARCAPLYFKDLSNEIQGKLVQQFPNHFTLLWQNGISGYEGYGANSTTNAESDECTNDMLRQMMIAMKWNESDSNDGERCIHHIPWEYCADCSDDLLQMHGF